MTHENQIGSYRELADLPPDEKAYAYYPGDYAKSWKLHLCLNKSEDVFPDLDGRSFRRIQNVFFTNESME